MQRTSSIHSPLCANPSSHNAAAPSRALLRALMLALLAAPLALAACGDDDDDDDNTSADTASPTSDDDDASGDDDDDDDATSTDDDDATSTDDDDATGTDDDDATSTDDDDDTSTDDDDATSTDDDDDATDTGEEFTTCNPKPLFDGFERDFRCPGCPGCENDDGALKIGVAKRPISVETEPFVDTNDNGTWDKGEDFTDVNDNGVWDPVWIANANGKLCTGKNDDLWARVATFRKGATSFAIVSVDLYGYFGNEVVQIRNALKDAGIDIDFVSIAATHNHSAADSVGLYGPSFGVSGYNAAWMADIRQNIFDAVVEAIANEREARIVFGEAEPTQDIMRDSRDPQIFDPLVHAFNFIDNEDKVFGTLINYGNHVEALGIDNRVLSADYAWGIYETLEAKYPDSIPLLVMNNVGGLMTPIGRKVLDKEGNETEDESFDRAFVMGELIADTAIAALESPEAFELNTDYMEIRKKVFTIPVENATFRVAFSLGVFKREAYDENGNIRDPDDNSVNFLDPAVQAFVQTETSILRLGDLAFINLPGEVYPETVLVGENGEFFYADRSPDADIPDAVIPDPVYKLYADLIPAQPKVTLVNNLTNDFLGYMVPEHQWDQKRPYINGKDTYGEENSLGPSAWKTIHANLKALLEWAPWYEESPDNAAE